MALDIIPRNVDIIPRVDRDPDASPLVHLQMYDDIEDAKAHSMVKGAMEADSIVTIPAPGGKDLYLVFEKYISFCVCLIGGTGKQTHILSLVILICLTRSGQERDLQHPVWRQGHAR